MIQFGIEPLFAARPDIEAMLPAQWIHTGDKDIECRPNWTLYHQFAERNALMVIVARELDCAVGYLAAFIYPHPNSVQTLIANIPTYFVVDRPLRALIMKRMVDFTAERLMERGIYKVTMETSARHSAGRLLELMGFEIDKIGYKMQLQKPQGERYA